MSIENKALSRCLANPWSGLLAGEVHIWIADLAQTDTVFDKLEQTLSQDEVERADRYAFAHLRRHFVMARGILRDILSRYTEEDPMTLVFHYNRFGKPSLLDSPIRFNLSHSCGVAIYAVTNNREIGVDVEYRHSEPVQNNFEQFISQTFSPGENRALLALPISQRREAFFNCWTRKEAYIKAVGDGLNIPLTSFEVSLQPGEPARLRHVADQPEEVNCWTYEVFQLSGDYTAAIIAEGRDWTARRWRWEALPATPASYDGRTS